MSKKKRVQTSSKKPSSETPEDPPVELKVEQQQVDPSHEVVAKMVELQQRLEEKKDELVQMYKPFILGLKYSRHRDLLVLLSRGQVPIDFVVNMLMLDYNMSKHEAEVIINNWVKLGLVIPRTVGGILAFKKRRARGCAEVYCSIDTPADMFNKCCEIEEFQQVVLEPTPVLEELIQLYYATREP